MSINGLVKLMKKEKAYLLLLCIMTMFSIGKVKAECDNKTQLEINTVSSNVTFNYNIDTVVYDRNGVLHPEVSPSSVEEGELSEYLMEDKVTIKIENVTDKIYVVLQNLDDGLNKEYHYNDTKNGTITYEVPDTIKIRTYKLIIYSAVSDCINQELRTVELKTPMYNQNSSYLYCENNDSYYCQEYVTSEIDGETAYGEYLESQESKKNDSETKKENEEESNKKNILNIEIIIVGVLVIVAIIRYRKKQIGFKQNIEGR